jgi:transcriptional regulator with XRE-family HTH domain
MQGSDLKRLRALAGMTQERAAQLLGVTHRTILRWEHGESRIGDLQAQAIRIRLVHQLFGQQQDQGEEEA